MKKSSTYFFITAVAAFACLCGILFAVSTPISTNNAISTSNTTMQNEVFSIEKARTMINLCSASYTPERLDKLLKEQGYGKFEYFSRDNSKDGIAAGIALKEEDKSTRVIAVFRGTYKEEWYSNFRIGEDTEHKGFSSAADYACNIIEDYILRQKKDSTKVILELTGHSRGGAVANITAKNFTDKGLMKRVYAYTFAAPNTTTAPNADASSYKSIYNIINTEDFIGYIPLQKWGYTKYGVNIELPQKESKEYSELYNSVTEIYQNLTHKNFVAYENGNKDIKSFINACEEISPTLWDYYNREITLEPYTITLSEYMNSAATLLSGEKDLSAAMLLISGSTSETLSPVTNFITTGIDPSKFEETTDFTDSPIGCGHSCETYSAWLQVLEETYFHSRIGE